MKRIDAKARTLVGVDVSKWQGQIDWHTLSTQISFAFSRVSDGTRYPDATFERNWNDCGLLEVPRGAYQYVRPTQSLDAQVNLFCERIEFLGGLQEQDLPPVCDIETTGDIPQDKVLEFVLGWCEKVKERLGRRPIIYTYPYFWEPITSEKIEYPLWIAHYTGKGGNEIGQSPLVPPSWDDWFFWQFTGTGKLIGVKGHIDINLFNGDGVELLRFIEDSKLTKTSLFGPSAERISKLISWNFHELREEMKLFSKP